MGLKRLSAVLKLAIAIASVTVLGGLKATAKDFSNLHRDSVMTEVLQGQQVEAILGEDVLSEDELIDDDSSPSIGEPSSGDSQIRSLTYEPDPELTQAGFDRFMQRIQNSDPELGQQLEELFLFVLSEPTDAHTDPESVGVHNPTDSIEAYNSTFAAAAGLEVFNPAHSMAAYTVVAWLIANQEGSPDTGSVRAVADRAEQILLETPAMTDDSNRQRLDEELVYMTFALSDVASHSDGSGGEDGFIRYSDEIHQIWMQEFGQDLRQVELTPQGFVQR